MLHSSLLLLHLLLELRLVFSSINDIVTSFRSTGQKPPSLRAQAAAIGTFNQEVVACRRSISCDDSELLLRRWLVINCCLEHCIGLRYVLHLLQSWWREVGRVAHLEVIEVAHAHLLLLIPIIVEHGGRWRVLGHRL